MKDLEERDMHELAKRLAELTEGVGWEAMRYAAIARTMEQLAEYCPTELRASPVSQEPT